MFYVFRAIQVSTRNVAIAPARFTGKLRIDARTAAQVCRPGPWASPILFRSDPKPSTTLGGRRRRMRLNAFFGVLAWRNLQLQLRPPGTERARSSLSAYVFAKPHRGCACRLSPGACVPLVIAPVRIGVATPPAPSPPRPLWTPSASKFFCKTSGREPCRPAPCGAPSKVIEDWRHAIRGHGCGGSSHFGRVTP